MFTVKDTVENRGSAPVTLPPYGLVSRHGQAAARSATTCCTRA